MKGALFLEHLHWTCRYVRFLYESAILGTWSNTLIWTTHLFYSITANATFLLIAAESEWGTAGKFSVGKSWPDFQ